MTRFVAIVLQLCLAVLLLGLVSWFESEQEKIEAVNAKHMREIRKLQNIKEINQWLEGNIEPYFRLLPSDSVNAEDEIIRFYDRYDKLLDLRVEKYIYDDTFSVNMDIRYTVPRDKPEALHRLIKLKNETGMLDYRSLTVKEGKVDGVIKIVQPAKGGMNATRTQR